MRKQVLILCTLFFTTIIQSCCGLWGSHDLGANFTLLEGDGEKQEIIVFCPPKKSGCCHGGVQVIPSIDDYYKGAYVKAVEFNDCWIIVQVSNKNMKTESYWIINKYFEIEAKYTDWPLEDDISKEFDKLIQAHIIGPMNLDDFNSKLNELRISLGFE